MASDGSPGTITGVSPVIGSQVSSGKSLPQGGKSVSTAAASIPSAVPQSSKTATSVVAPAPTSTSKTSIPASSSVNVADTRSATTTRSAPQALVDQVNKYLNNSGRPDQFRVDPTSSSYIQQVNPSTGAVIAEYSVNEFPALARSVGASGLLIDDVA